MAKERSIFMGPRIRRLRRDLGLTQVGMAEDLEVSPSYIALIETNQRPVTASMLLKLAEIYRTDIASLARGAGDDFSAQITATFKSPLFADLDLSPLEIQDFASTFPATAEAVLRLYTAYQEGQMALADQTGGESTGGPDPVSEARRFLAARKNYFLEIDNKAEDLAQEIKRVGGYEQYFADQRLRVRHLPSDVMMGFTRRFDMHRREIVLDEALDNASANFQLALQIAYMEMTEVIADSLAGTQFDTESGEKLTKRALASYAAGAIMMPYHAFAKAAKSRHYDIEALGRQFGASFEQVAHRLTTLQKTGQEGVPFFFIRVDAAGNVSKRLDGAGFPFARHGGSCPLWSVHSAFKKPREVITQWVELPDGERFFSVVRTVTAGGGGYGRPQIERAIALCCSSQHAHKLVYTQGTDISAVQPTPIGVTCRLCHRADCLARAEPPIGRSLLSDDYRRPSTPFGLVDP
jgi:predicted transcriptional regulator/transcriptional regulator with XRE-family HTH domain